MTPEEIATKIIDMQEGESWTEDPKWYFNTVMDYIKLAIHLEREACAEIAEQVGLSMGLIKGIDAQKIAQAIRARGKYCTRCDQELVACVCDRFDL